MLQNMNTGVSRKRRFSLSMYIPLLLALTATIPLLATIGSLEFFLRPALISQASTSMESSAQTQVQLIDAYLSERLNDINTLSKSTSLKLFLGGHKTAGDAVNDILTTIQHRDVANYINLSVIDTKGNVSLFYPVTPQAHGKYLIVPEALQQLQNSEQVVVSNVFYDQVGNVPSIDMYARVTDANFNTIGYVRASLGLRRIWSSVDAVTAGSNSFILDHNGVRIAYTNSDASGFTRSKYLFKAIDTPSPTLMRQITSENLYGNGSTAVTSLADPNLTKMQQNTQSPSTSQLTPVGENQDFEVARYSSAVVPWTYYTMTPLSSVTGLIDQQLLTIIGIAVLVLIVALIIGLFVGQRMALPILRSVSLLHKNSESLKVLAEEENVMATEQGWMAEASQTALDSVRYYTSATGVAVQHIQSIGDKLLKNQQHLDINRLNKSLQNMIEAANYIEQANRHQESMNEKLQTSLRVTTQTSDQLTNGANSTNEAATQIETIVEQLTAVVGE
jgi:methyl-accepting chemotaxis protein